MNTAAMTETRTRADALTRTMPLLLTWLLVALWLALSGALASRSGAPVALGAAIAVPLFVFWLDGRRGHPLFLGLARLDAPTLALLQTFRVLGVVFLVAWWRGTLPAGFALPAGIGDVAVGVTAPLVAAALARGGVGARRLFVAWNLLGLLDLVLAVGSGVLHASNALGLLATSPTTDAMAVYPFSLIPTFLVPIAVMLHALGLGAKHRPGAPTALAVTE